MINATLLWFAELNFAIFLLFLEGFLELLWVITPIDRWQDFLRQYLFGTSGYENHTLVESDTPELVTARGYAVEEHFVQTKDGFFLGLHRVLKKDGGKTKGAVLLMHGCMMNSEGWVCREPKDSLAFLLASEGYDVWLGNNRGNKYSHKHVSVSPTQPAFWNWSIDELAAFDVPAMVNYILEKTQFPKITYVGFSQGTAQAFAAFSSNEELCKKINIFIALAPAARVSALSNPAVSAVSTSKPKLIFLLFGNKIMLGQSLFWRKVLNYSFFVWTIDASFSFLFGWDATELDPREKVQLYSHLYSYSSVKNVVHWFQIMHSKRFQMFDDNIQTSNKKHYRSYEVPCYHPSKIKCPVAMFYGGRDNVLVMPYLLEQLPQAYSYKEDNYEHLDMIWAKTAPERIFPKVIELIHSHN